MLLLLAALPTLFWDGAADTAPALRQAGITKIQVPAARLAGWKGAPEITAEAADLQGSGYRGGDEFGYLDVDDPAKRPALGDEIEFIPPHCDPTVNLYPSIYACRGNQVEAVWPVKSLVL